MKSTESLLQDIFSILAFVTIFILRVVVGSVKLAIYIYQTIQSHDSLQQSEINTIAEPITELLISDDATEVRTKSVRVVKLVMKYTVKGCIFIYTNAPTFYQDVKGFCIWAYDSIATRFAPKPALLSITASIEEV